MVLARELDLLEGRFDVARHGAERSSLDVGLNLNTTRLVFTLNCVRDRRNANVGHVREAHFVAAWRVDQKVADVVHTVARTRHAPDVDIVGLSSPCPPGKRSELCFRPAANEDVADLLAGHPDGSRASYVARLDAILLCSGEVWLDLHLRDVNLELYFQFLYTLH